jgi:hypothetical protein
MRFLLDESADLPLADYLRAKGHDVTTIVEDYTRSIKDRASSSRHSSWLH